MKKNVGMLLAVMVALSGQTPALSPAPGAVKHFVYQFGFNTTAKSSGQGTGNTTVDILGPAKDGGVIIQGTDYWWNTVRPRATNTCELYRDGSVTCSQAPYAISPMQLTIFPLLARGFFKQYSPAANSTWQQTYKVTAAIAPGSSSPFANTPITWTFAYTFTNEGVIPNAGGAVKIGAKGKLTQQGGRYFNASSKQQIAYDPKLNIPIAVTDVRQQIPQQSVYTHDVVSLNLLKYTKPNQ